MISKDQEFIDNQKRIIKLMEQILAELQEEKKVYYENIPNTTNDGTNLYYHP